MKKHRKAIQVCFFLIVVVFICGVTQSLYSQSKKRILVLDFKEGATVSSSQRIVENLLEILSTNDGLEIVTLKGEDEFTPENINVPTFFYRQEKKEKGKNQQTDYLLWGKVTKREIRIKRKFLSLPFVLHRYKFFADISVDLRLTSAKSGRTMFSKNLTAQSKEKGATKWFSNEPSDPDLAPPSGVKEKLFLEAEQRIADSIKEEVFRAINL